MIQTIPISLQINLEQVIAFFVQLPLEYREKILETLQNYRYVEVRTQAQKIQYLEKFKGKLAHYPVYTPSKYEWYEQ